MNWSSSSSEGDVETELPPDSFAAGFFASYCVGCHDTTDRDYRAVAHVMRDSATIRCGVSPDALADCGSFPPPG